MPLSCREVRLIGDLERALSLVTDHGRRDVADKALELAKPSV
jgi:hypothetical protein